MELVYLLKRIKNRNGSLGRYYEEGDDGVVISLECRTCDSLKNVDEFHKSRSGFAGRVTQCKTCVSEKTAMWDRENKGKKLKYMQDFYVDNRERLLAYQRAYYIENAEAVRERSLEWARNNPDKTRLNRHKREARINQLEDTLTESQLSAIWETFNHSCALSGRKGDIHLDHVIPVSTGHGGTTIRNIIPLHATLNVSKNASNIFEWFELNKVRFNLDDDVFERLIEYLAGLNDMTSHEYRDYVYDCHANPNDILTEVL